MIEPSSGDSFFMEYSVLDSVCFSDYLSKFSRENPKSLNIIFVDGSGGHTAKDVKIPKNVILHVIPPCCPELNPQERIWEELKDDTSDEIFKDLDSMRVFLYDKINSLTKKALKSLSFFTYIREYFVPKFQSCWIGV